MARLSGAQERRLSPNVRLMQSDGTESRSMTYARMPGLCCRSQRGLRPTTQVPELPQREPPG